MKHALVCAIALFLCSPALGDVVKLKTGGSISGTVIKDDDKAVVVKTPNGKVTLPRHMVAEVVKQSPGETTLALARERVKSGDHDEAIRLFEEAARDSDPAVAQKAKTELLYFKAKQKRVLKFRQPPSTPWALPEGLDEVKPLEGKSLQEQFDRARRAVERKDGRRALRLLLPMLDAKPDDQVLRFLVGRAHQFAGEKEKAREQLLASFSASTYRFKDRPLEWIVELARREQAGEKITAAPGVSSDWRRLGSEHFAIYHTLNETPQWLARMAESIYVDALEAFNFKKRDVYIMGKIVVFLFPNRADWQADERWGQPEAHAVARAAPDGLLRVITAYPDEAFVRHEFAHEVAHAIVDDVYPTLPLWVREGAAARACPIDVRERLVAEALKKVPDVKAYVRGEVQPGSTDRKRALFRAHSALLFEVLAKQFSPRKVLELGKDMTRKDPEKVLLYSQFSLRDLTKAVDAAAERQ